MIRKEIKEKYPSIMFDELEKYMLEYENRYFSRVVPKKNNTNELIGHKGVIFLLQSLQRSRSLFTGFIDCVNLTHVILGYLSVRAHFETTGSVAYLLWNLRRHYKGEIDKGQMITLLDRLGLSLKTFPNKDFAVGRPKPINVLTQIDIADKLYKDAGGRNLGIFRQCYDFLSEFCHPNTLGLIVASAVTEDFELVLHKKPEFREENFGTLINHMLISCYSLFYAYDEAFSVLKDNEQIPDLIKLDGE